MIEKAEFAAGLGTLALQLRHPLAQAEIDAYHIALGTETDAREWLGFCRGAAVRFGWRFLPSVPELVDALREHRGQPKLEVEATRAYEAVLAAGDYAPEEGRVWSYRGVLARCGRAAAEAFLEAGGHHAFASTFRESDRRERFIAAYRVASRAVPEERLLLGAPAAPALPPPADAQPPSREEAATVIRRLQDLSGVEPAPPPGPRQVVASEARLELLRRQARELAMESHPAEVEQS